MTTEQELAVRIALGFIRSGIPVFAAPPFLDEAGAWNPDGGCGGYALPVQWQRTVPTENWLDPTVRGFESKAWRPGYALCAVMGRGVDALDTDPRSGGDASRAALIAEGVWPTVYAIAETPSGGTHELVASLGVGSKDGLRDGLDLKGGRADGSSRGFVFIAPTVKRSKTTGALVSYRWAERTSLTGMDADTSGQALAALVRPVKPVVASAPPVAARPPADNAEGRRLAKYLETARSLEVARLRAMAAAAVAGGHGYSGEPWDSTTFEVACGLLELANADWNSYGTEQAHADVLREAPRDAGFDGERIAKCFESATKTVGAKARDYPAARLDLAAEVSSWASAPGVRLDPLLTTAPTVPAETGISEQLTDAHLTDRVARDVLAGRFCWSAALGWLGWDGRRWASTDEAAVTEAIRLYVIDWLAKEAKAGSDSTRLKALTSLCSRGRIAALVSLSRGVAHVEPAALDTHPDLLNVGNGVVDLRTGALLPHDPALLLTKVTPVDYRPDARHGDLSAALQAVPPAVVPWLQVRLGQASSGHMTSDDVLPVCQGGGANGKSTFLTAVASALGEHAVTVPERVLLANPSDHPTELMTLRGARLAIIEELPEGGRLSVKRLKDTCGTATMTARLMHRDNVSWSATHSLVLATNYRPAVSEVDHGTWRRLALVRFPFTYVSPSAALVGPRARHGDPGLRDRMLQGRNGQHEAVLAWLVQGARRWYDADRLMPAFPAEVAGDTAAWRAEADRVHAYWSERLVADPASHIVATDLFADFSEWLAGHGYSGWSDATLATRLGGHELATSHGVEKRRVYAGTLPSRRPGTFPSMPSARYMAWAGVRFATAVDDPAHAPSQGRQGSSDLPLEWAS